MFNKLLTATSTSLEARYLWFLDRTLTRSDLVIEGVNSFETVRFIYQSLQSWLYYQNSLAKLMNLQREADHTTSRTLILILRACSRVLRLLAGILYLRLSKYGSTKGSVKLLRHGAASSPKEPLGKLRWETIFGQFRTLNK